MFGKVYIKLTCINEFQIAAVSPCSSFGTYLTLNSITTDVFYQSGSQIDFFFENFIHCHVRKLFVHLKEAVLHLKLENQCWICQYLVAFQIWSIESEAKRAQTT